ncbi:MAG: glycoside hydrolase family 13 protein [Firmicutes bacterium]|nr:glycoside hydrolase family 13 protein [Bacillota bacterium]
MNLHAVRHIPMSADAFAIAEYQAVFRLRAARNDLTRCTLFVGDRSCRKTPVDSFPYEMKVAAQDELFDWYEARPVLPFNRVCYYFKLENGGESILYYGDLFAHETVPDRSEYFQLPILHRADIPNVPDWVYDAVVYNIFPDSFATGKRYVSREPMKRSHGEVSCEGMLGGTIRGITENLDYIERIGFNTIYLNPIFTAGEYHKYDLLDYFHIDPCFGTDEDFRRLVDTLHARGIRVIIDGVFNHCGWRFFAFEDVVKNGKKSKYWDWFYQLEEPVIRPDDEETYPNYVCFGYERKMPKIALDNPETRGYFLSVGEHWVKEYDIDGWRLDVASEVNDGFWRAFRRTVKTVKPDCLLIGEIWESAPHWLDGTMFDSAMNYDFRKHLRRFFAERSISAAAFDGRVAGMRMRYREPFPYAQLNLLDSHDVSRFFSLCGGDECRMRLAVVFQMTAIGMPCVFYGDELGIQGICELEYRQPMPWGEGESRPLRELYTKLIKLRNQSIALRRGNCETLECDGGFYAFKRAFEDETVRVYINNADESRVVGIINDRVLDSYNCKDGIINSYGYVITSDERDDT